MTENTPPASGPGGPTARKRVQHHATVSAVRRLTPSMVRVTITGPELTELDATPYTDRYVKLVVGELADGRPQLRTYTVRHRRGDSWDLDFVVHGTEGVAGPWAASVVPGEAVTFIGPGGGYAPDPEADWHLLVGDGSALPAISAAAEQMPAGAVVHAFVEVEGPADEQEIVTAADLRLTWVHHGTATLEDVVRAAHDGGALPGGTPHVFLHGEAGCVRELRRWARGDLGVPLDRLSASGYWRRGTDDEGWRVAKRDWNTAVEQDDAALAHA